jgi:hypothetical protein
MEEGGPVKELVITGFREQEWLLINGPHSTETFPPFIPHDGKKYSFQNTV